MRLRLSVGFMCLCLIGSAQNFVKAKIITIKGDTLFGEAMVNDKKPMMKFEKVVFKDQTGIQKNYKPEKLLEYYLGEDRFISLDTDGYPRFYKVLASGAINLYELMVEMQVGNKIVPETEYYLSNAGNKKLVGVKSKKFKKQLLDWMGDYQAIAAKYDKEEFDLALAVTLLNEYNTAKLQH